jgi:uncharacterized protein YjbI with pentapeptide repeats
VPVVAFAVLLIAGITLLVLWQWIDSLTLTDPDNKATAQLDAVKTASGIAVGGGGLFALYLAARRQRTQELELAQRDRAQDHTERIAETTRLHAEQVARDAREDAAARRITELYTKASEQLGSDKAPVRLAGLYALERLGQDNQGQRQTVVNVLCAYLRMPYQTPDEQTPAEHRARTEELQVRLTAQRILADHLHPGDDPRRPDIAFWPDADLDLTHATLIDLTLDDCAIRTIRLDGAQLTGETRFARTTVTGRAEFRQSRFTGRAEFRDTTFTGETRFDRATFAGRASFYRTRFTGKTRFDGATLLADARFDYATFTQDVSFYATTFTGDARFSVAKFTRRASFGTAYVASDGDGTQIDAATFAAEAWFDGATFTLNAWFGRTTFTGTAHFSGADFPNDAGFTRATFAAEARFDRATFAGRTDFDEVTFTGDTRFDGATLPSKRYLGDGTSAPWTNFTGTRFVRSVPPEVAGFVSTPPED